MKTIDNVESKHGSKQFLDLNAQGLKPQNNNE